ncbi:hypothetical protein ZHAS_00011386 [Anopheles sinensis]|uniref:Uncharacterized protein n=1 Tax=Anopheles sinensis TaxID=74873 RepID=A0A084W0B6_ANOSI|nr:hypothetical protein ZHAS_00011386 [Anopheles sinensis]
MLSVKKQHEPPSRLEWPSTSNRSKVETSLVVNKHRLTLAWNGSEMGSLRGTRPTSGPSRGRR